MKIEKILARIHPESELLNYIKAVVLIKEFHNNLEKTTHISESELIELLGIDHSDLSKFIRYGTNRIYKNKIVFKTQKND